MQRERDEVESFRVLGLRAVVTVYFGVWWELGVVFYDSGLVWFRSAQ